MQYEYAISDTAIAEKKLVYRLSLFASSSPPRCIYCGGGFAFRIHYKKVFFLVSFSHDY